jgi:hypothetical protein
MDQILERVAGHEFYCFLDGYSGYNQIDIAFEDQEKTTFTCPFSIFAYRRMFFGLYNAPTTFQRYVLSIFSVIWLNVFFGGPPFKQHYEVQMLFVHFKPLR